MMLNAQGYQMMLGGATSPVSARVDQLMQLCHYTDSLSSKYLVNLSYSELTHIAKDSQGSRVLQHGIGESRELRKKILHLLIDMGKLMSLAMDCFGNFVIQKMLLEPDVSTPVACSLLENGLQLSLNRHSCRVIQKLVARASPEALQRLFDAYKGNEGMVAMDPNGNHIVQRIMEFTLPSAYAAFFRALSAKPGILHLMMDKYGCRVVQTCLEKLVFICSSDKVCEENKRVAFEILHLVMVPILKNARALAENDHGNYIVQLVLRMECLATQRHYVIASAILHNVLWLSQGKFSSHVVEQALRYAEPTLLRAMFDEILTGYEADERGRDALDILLFDQFGNYVVQCLFKTAIEVYEGRRAGDRTWFSTIATRVMQSESNLRRYSSGKKLLHMVQDVLKQCAYSTQTHLLSTAQQPQMVYSSSMIPMPAVPYSDYPTVMVQQQPAAPSFQQMMPSSLSVPFALPTFSLSLQQAVDGWSPFG